MSAAFLSASWHRVSALRPQLAPQARTYRQRYRGRAWYVLHDAASGRMYRFTPAVYLVLSLMDGRRSLDEIWAAAAEQLGEESPSQDEVIRLLGQLHGADMLQAGVPPDMEELAERGRKHSRALLRRNLLNPLAIRLRIPWDPDAFLERTLPYVGWLFGPAGLLLWVALVLPGLLVAAMHWGELTENLSDRVLGAGNLLLLWLAYPVVKTLHELGHAYATKRDGGEVHDLGIMILVLMPIPYVDASAATAFRSKWRRMLVGAAGMLVELFLAALALYVWLAVEPGLVRALAFNVMLIGGASTVLFNGNPLLRYDGYYILTDVIEMPNLGQRAARYWAYLAKRYGFGKRDAQSPADTAGERAWLAAYGASSFAYRLLVMVAIALFVANEYFFIGVILALWSVASMLVLPAAKALRVVFSGADLQRQRTRAIAVTTAALALIAAFALFVPLPLNTRAEGVIWVPENAQLRMRTAGFVGQLLVKPGDTVEAGEPVFSAENSALEAEVKALRARIEQLEVRLGAELFEDRAQAAITRDELQQQSAALARAEQRLDELLVLAPAAGRVVLPNAVDLPGRFVRQGQLIGYVLDGTLRTVRVVVGQDDIELVRQRLRGVEVKIADRLEDTYPARMLREVPGGSDQLPTRALSIEGGGPHGTDPRDPDGLRTLQRLFQFDVELPEQATPVALGTRVFVRFIHDSEPLGLQLYRRIRQLFLTQFHV